MLGFPRYLLARERQAELLREAESNWLVGWNEGRARLPGQLMSRVGLMLIRVGLDMLEHYDPALTLRREACQPATGSTRA
jgi:hypothetical protein